MTVTPARGVGLDLATRKSGVFWSLDEEPQGSRLLKAKGIDTMCVAIYDALVDLKPDYVAVEATYIPVVQTGPKKGQMVNPAVRSKLDELRGVARLYCAQQAIPLYVATTDEINSRIGIGMRLKRALRKRRIQDWAAFVGWPDLSEDEADALAVLWWGHGERRKDEWIRTGTPQ